MDAGTGVAAAAGKVLLVGPDGEESTRWLEVLEGGGHGVRLQRRTLGVERVAAEESPDLLLVVPGEAWGPEAAAICVALRRAEATRDLPVLVLVPPGAPADEILAVLAAGATDFVGADATPRQLLDRVAVAGRLRPVLGARQESDRLDAIVETAGAVAHELSQPVTALLGAAELLGRVIGDDPASTRKLDLIRECGRKIQEAVERLRAVRRYETTHYHGGVRIVDLERAAARVETDRLTGLRTQGYLSEVLREELGVASRARVPITCLLFEVHAPGGGRPGTPAYDEREEHVAAVAGLLRHHVGADDHLVRYGEAEFAMVLHGQPLGTARTLATTLIERAAACAWTGPGEGPPVDLRCGIASYPVDTLDPDVDTLVQNAGAALRAALADGERVRAFADLEVDRA